MSSFTWKPNIRPYDESMALKQAITTSAVAGNVVKNNPMRLDQSQGGTAIRVVVPREIGSTLTTAANATITLTVKGAKTQAGTAITLGTAVYTNDTGAVEILGSDATVVEYVLSEAAAMYPYISVTIQGSAAPTGTVDIFPHQISHPRR